MSALSCGDGVKLAGDVGGGVCPSSWGHPALGAAVPLCSEHPGRIFPAAQATAAAAPTTPGVCSQASIHDLRPTFKAFSCPLLWDPRARSCPSHLEDDSLLEQALLLGRHDEIVSVVLVVHDVFQVNPW